MKPAKRPFFRFHLLTLVLMALAAGGFLWPNTRGKMFIHNTAKTTVLRTAYGWPCICYAGKVIAAVDETSGDMIPPKGFQGIADLPDMVCGALINASALFLILLIVAIISEFFIIRRREGRKP